MRKWWSTAPSGVKTFTFSREMTPEEAEETSKRMEAVFARMDRAFVEMDEVFISVRAKNSGTRNKPKR